MLLWHLQDITTVGHIYGLSGTVVRHTSAGSGIEPITLRTASEFLKFLQKISYIDSGYFCRAYVGFSK